jgi:hypothetical protein
MTALAPLTTLTTLDLSYCDALTNWHLAAALPPLTALQRLELTGCSQVTDGLLPALAPLSRLTTLCTAHCYDLLAPGDPTYLTQTLV